MHRRPPHPAIRALLAIATMAAAAIGAGLPAHAQQAAGEPSGWTFQLTPYAWLANLEGNVATLPGLPPTSVDVSFHDILENTEEAVILAAEARHGRVGIITDLTYLGVSTDGNTPGALFGKVEANVDTLFATAAGFYRPIATEAVTVDVLAGARIWYIDTELKLDAGLLPGRQTQEDETWVDPVIGIRASLDLGHGFFISGLADIGGFDVGSDHTWEAMGTVGYRFRDWLSARAGYRHLEVDYEDGGYVFDVEMSGPIFGVSFQF